MKVGDYVRTKSGEIARIDECKGKDKVYKNMEHYETDRMVTKFNNFILYKEDIIKSSPNIIDLIEVGDYVNGCLVSEIKDKWLILNYADIETYEQLERKNENIKSIVTKEQFESVQYIVGSDEE